MTTSQPIEFLSEGLRCRGLKYLPPGHRAGERHPLGSRGVATLMMPMALVAVLAGCSAKMKFSSKALCENAGGRYVQMTCQPGTPKGAADMCQAHGGVYLAGEDNCIIFEK